MVNLVATEKSLAQGLMKMGGLKPQTVEIEPGTVMKFWVSTSTKRNHNKEKKNKPAVVLVHGFAADGIVTWQFQVGALISNYNVYVPDLLFFGGSTSSSSDRSPAFQAECLSEALKEKLGVDKCTVVGFSYGGIVAFQMAQLHPSLVSSLVISGAVVTLTESMVEKSVKRLGFSSCSDMLLPTTVDGVKTLLSVGTYKKLRFPTWLFRHYFEVMLTHRKERGELLESLVISNEDATIPNFPQKILLLWGNDDQIFNLEIAKNLNE